MEMYNNVFYFNNINVIGGVETFFYYLSKRYKDMVVFYKNGDYQQIKRLAKNVEVHKYKGQKIRCKRLYLNYNISAIDNFDADEYIQIIHADYKAQGLRPRLHPKITRYIGVSKLACESFEELTGVKCELCYNYVDIDTPKKTLLLVSATRLTAEKGRDRMVKLCNILDKAKIPYLWLVFTNSSDIIDNPHIVYMQPRLDIISYIKKADYLVQLSSCESYCFSVVESLLCATPVICTDLPALHEIGVEHGKNGFFVDLDMKNVDTDAIYKGLGDFSYTPPKSNWDISEKSDYDPNESVRLLPNVTIHDIEFGGVHEKGIEFTTPRWRANYLIDLGYANEVR